jgi:2-polyprenyl-6-methoxyphenol hydroxylase-like FAD-dependent oxidoreductase
MAGLVLTRRGVRVVVVDQKEGPTRESRALAVQARTMEIYDQLRLADQVLSGAYPGAADADRHRPAAWRGQHRQVAAGRNQVPGHPDLRAERQ